MDTLAYLVVDDVPNSVVVLGRSEKPETVDCDPSTKAVGSTLVPPVFEKA